MKTPSTSPLRPPAGGARLAFRVLGLAGLVAFGVVSLPGSSRGQGGRLLVPTEYATLGAAIAAAVAGDSVLVSDENSPYAEMITLADGVVYQGGWNTDFTEQNALLHETILELPADSTGSVVDCGTAGSETIFAAFTVQGGNSSFTGGGIFCGNGTELLIRNCIVQNNYSDDIGGGITIGENSAAQVFNCLIRDNVSRRRGGGIHVVPSANSAARIEQCTIERCSTAGAGQTSGGGGGLFLGAPIVFERNTVQACTSGYHGGGLFVANNDVAIVSAWVSGNVAAEDGGGFYFLNGAGAMWGSSVDSCEAGGNGGGICFDGGGWEVNESFIRYNRAGTAGGGAFGGGIYFERSHDARLGRTEVHGNEADNGAGLAILGTSLARFTSVQLYNNTISANVSGNPDGAGGIDVRDEFFGPFVNNIIAHHVGWGIRCEGALAQPNIRYNCVYNDDGFNPPTEYGGSCTDRTGINGNRSADPRLCDFVREPPDLRIPTDSSPCVGTGENDVDMGAHPAVEGNCGDGVVVSIEDASWGSIKARYR